MLHKIACLIICFITIALCTDLKFKLFIVSDYYYNKSPYPLIAPVAVGINDIDNDGLHNLIVVRDGGYTGNGKIQMLSYSGNKKYEIKEIADSVANTGTGFPVVFGDFNGDKRKDFAYSKYIFINKGMNTFNKVKLDNSNAYAESAFDVDSDGDIDLLYSNFILMINDGKGNFTGSVLDPLLVLQQNSLILPIDWDKDDDLDILCYDGDTPSGRGVLAFVVYRNDGNNHFTRRDIISSKNAWSYFPIDFDLDGDYEIGVVDSQISTTLRLFEETNTFYYPVEPTITIPANQKQRWLMIDMDHDGITDIFPGGNFWIKNTGKRLLELYPITFESTNYTGGTPIPYDFENDGDIDFLYYSSSSSDVSGTVVWLINNLAPEIDSSYNRKSIVAGLKDTIRWNSSYEGKVKISYTVDAGKTWQILSSSCENSGHYVWTVPRSLSDSCRLFISDERTGDLRDTSEGFFSIVRGKILINAPDQNDSIVIGDTCRITWTRIGEVGPVDLFYKSNKDSFKMGYSEDTINQFTWIIKNILPSRVSLDIRSNSEPYVFSMNPVQLTILDTPSISIISPNGGEKLYSSQPLTLQWSATNWISHIKAYISVDSGNTWELFADSIPNTGRYSKKGSFDYSFDRCFIKLTCINREKFYDISDSSFFIKNPGTAIRSEKKKSGLSVNVKKEEQLLVFELSGEESVSAVISLYSLAGQRVFSTPVYEYRKGISILKINRALIKPGMYLLKINGTISSITKRIVFSK
jgi:hypothetical protein